jgi:hypothetical protein
MKKIIVRSLLLGAFLTGCISAETLSANPLRYRTFASGQSLWMWDHAQMLQYRYDTRILKNLSLGDSVGSDTILDVVENSGVLWMVAPNGLYQVDLNTATVEHIPGGPASFSAARVAADVDFVWVAQKDALWKFDKLSREWFTFPYAKMGTAGEGSVGVSSDGNKVYLVTKSAVEQFSIAEEKWSEYPFKNFSFSPSAEFYPGKQSLIVVEKAKIYRYVIAQLSWDVVTAPADIIDFYPSDEKIDFLTTTGAFQYTASSSVLQPFDIPDAKNIRGISPLNDTTLVLTGEKTLIEYNTTNRTTENIPYPQQLPGSFPVKVVTGEVLLYPDAITLYNLSTRTWELYRIPSSNAGKSAVTWDESGLKMRYAPGFESQLKGSITQRFKLIDGGYWNDLRVVDSLYDSATGTWSQVVRPVPTTQRLFYYTPGHFGKDLYSDLTLHTTLSGSRYADLFFQKQTGNLPQKGLFYRGEPDDPLESARLGTNTLTIPASQTLPSVQYEGASAIVHSREGLATRDRKIVRAQAGAGLATSRTMDTTLSYNKENIYKIKLDTANHIMIMPGSLRINVDGEDIDTMQYTLVPLTGDIAFERRDLLDPSSVIIATYKVQKIPDSGLEVIEFVPKNHYGQVEFATATVSPRDWVSVAGTYTTLQDSSHAKRRNIGTIMAPFEFREADKNMMLKLTPEFSYETSKQARAGGLGLQSRIGDWALGKATSLILNYNALDRDFNTTDVISRGYGKMRNDLNVTFEHDVLTELPVVYTEADRNSVFGSEHYRLASAGAHFQNLPFLDVQWSQNAIDVDKKGKRDTLADSASDTTRLDTLMLGRTKSKVKVRLYELSSPAVQSLLHLNKFGYDFSYSRFSSTKESQFQDDTITGWHPPKLPGSGDIFFGSSTICPISSIIITGQTTYKNNTQDSLLFDSLHTIGLKTMELNPTLTIQTIDAPPGIDFNAYYSADYKGSSIADTQNTTHFDTAGVVAIQRKFYVITKPGVWTKYLSWMSPRFGISENLSCRFDTVGRTTSQILFGTAGRPMSSVTKSFGVHLYPTDDIVIRQENDYTTSDSVTNFHMFNDAKWWFGANRLWQTRWEYNGLGNGPNVKRNIHKMFTFFDATWFSWLRTNEKLSADYTRKDSTYKYSPDTTNLTLTRDTTAVSKTLNVGPEISVSFSVQQAGLVKTLLNGHSAKLTWQEVNGRFKRGAVFTYSNFINLIIKPNLSFESNNAISLKQNYVSYNGDLSFSLLF